MVPGAAIWAWTAYLRNKAAGEELSEEEETKYAPPVRVAQGRGLGAWQEFDAFRFAAQAHINQTIAGTRWILIWRVIDGQTSFKARLAAKGSQDPELQQGIAEAAGCVSLRLPHLQIPPLRAPKWRIWSPDIQKALFLADSFPRDVCVRAPSGWGSHCSVRAHRLHVAAYGYKDAAAALYATFHKYLMDKDRSSGAIGLTFRVSEHDPCTYYVARVAGPIEGVPWMTAHVDDILWCGESGIMGEVRMRLTKRLGTLEHQETAFAHARSETSQSHVNGNAKSVRGRLEITTHRLGVTEY